mmetsp:Transcript_10084/g.32382  ORF Transcript_10084/g.32382 Transcript_10084/m.32382 type:complete len:223 (-) Transcript_10084:1205-1873(-)
MSSMMSDPVCRNSGKEVKRSRPAGLPPTTADASSSPIDLHPLPCRSVMARTGRIRPSTKASVGSPSITDSNSRETASSTRCCRLGASGETASTLRSTTSDTPPSIVRKSWFCAPKYCSTNPTPHTGTPRRDPVMRTCPSQYAGVAMTEMSSWSSATAASSSTSSSLGTRSAHRQPYLMKVRSDVHAPTCAISASALQLAPSRPTSTALSTIEPRLVVSSVRA